MIRFKLERYQHKWAGYKKILQSRNVQALLDGKAQRVKSAIDLPEVNEDWEVIVSTRVGRNRARALVSGVPTSIEKKRAVLGSAIDAARG